MGELIRPAPMREFDVGERRATWLELFFDLCFVAAVAALAAGLHADPTLRGLWHFAALFVPVWWAWMEFTWFATAWDNDDLMHRLGMLLAMLLVIVLAAGIPRVYEGNDRLFVVAYASMQVLLVVMFARVLPHAGPARRFVRNYMLGDGLGGLIMLSSLLVEPPSRYWVWALAVTVLMVAPVFAVRAYEGQPFDSRHIPERYGLFTIIVLGESIAAATVAVGAAIDTEVAALPLLTLGVGGLVVVCSLWWIYFDFCSGHAPARGVGAQYFWSYVHYFVFTALAVIGAGLALSVAWLTDPAHVAVPEWSVALLVGGAVAVFLIAIALIETFAEGNRDGSHLLTKVVASALAIAAAFAAPVLTVAGSVVAIALILAALVAWGVRLQHGLDREAR